MYRGRPGVVITYTNPKVLTVSYDEDTLAQYRDSYEPSSRRIQALTDARLFENRHPSPQPFLWDLGDVEWYAVQRLRPYGKRHSTPWPVCRNRNSEKVDEPWTT